MKVGRKAGVAVDECYFLGLYCAKLHFLDVYFAGNAASLRTWNVS